MNCRIRKNYWQQAISKREYLWMILVEAIGVGIISYLFYGTIFYSVLLSPYVIFFFKSWKRQLIEKKKTIFRLQFKEALQSMNNALNVGYSVENAVRETWSDLQILYKKDTMIVREFSYMVRQLGMNITLEQVLQEFAERMQEEDVQTFATVFMMAKRSGGDLIGILKNTVQQMTEKADVQREIATVISAKKLEFQVMSIVPFGMILYMKMSFPEFMSVLYGNVVGVVIMTVCFCVYAGAYEVGKRMVEIEV